MADTIKTIITADVAGYNAALKKAADATEAFDKKVSKARDKSLSSGTMKEDLQKELEVLKLQASGQEAAANSLREFITVRKQAIAFAEKANITEQEAMRLMQERLILQKRIADNILREKQSSKDSADLLVNQKAAEAARAKAIANPRSTGLPGGGELIPLTPRYLAIMEKGAARTGELARQSQLAGRGGMAGSMGFLAFSQAVEDAQYGVRGILNNIPQMVLGFGGGLGLAGALSLAAVAASQLYPVLRKLYGSTENDDVQKAADEWASVFQSGLKAANAIGETAAAEARLANLSVEYNSNLAERLALLNSMSGAYDSELAAQRAARDAAAEIASARENQVSANGGDPSGLILDRQRKELAGIQTDLANRKAELARVSEESQRLGTTRSNISAEAAAAEAAITEELIRLTTNLAGAKANLAQAEAAKKAASVAGNNLGAFGNDTQEFSNQSRNVTLATQSIAALEKQITLLKEQQTVSRDTNAAAINEADAQINALDSKINKTYQEIQALEQLKATREALNKIERENVAFANAKKELSGLQKNQGTLEKTADAAADQEAAVDTLADELELLREATAQGGKKLEQVREEIALRREALQLAEDAGISELDARNILRERADLLKKLEKPEVLGTIKERREARSAEREAERERKRNERVAEAERKRKEKGPDGKPVDLKPANDLDQIRKDAEEKRRKADEDVSKNIQKQTDLQERIEKAISKISAA